MKIKYRVKKVTSSYTKEVKYVVQWKFLFFWNNFLKYDKVLFVTDRLFDTEEEAEKFKEEVMILNQTWE
jgi:hypothetical protein